MPHRSGKPHSCRSAPAGFRGASLIALALGAGLLAATGFQPVPPAEAQSAFNAWDSPPKARKKKRRASETSSKKSSETKKAEAAQRKAMGPLVINVSLARQRLTVFDATGPIATSPVSSGRAGYATPTGVFTVVQKRRQHYSNLYAGASMPNMQRLTWSGVALHAGALPGYPASHGCIRLPHGFSRQLFGMTSMGTRVIVTRDPVTPVPFEHDRLFAAYPNDDELASLPGHEQQAEMTRVADASLAAGGSADSMSAVLGVAAAAAAENQNVRSSLPPARAQFLARRESEQARLLATIRTAGYERATKAARLDAAEMAAETAGAALTEARAEAERLAEKLTQLEESLQSAERELDYLTKPREETDKRKRKTRKSDESKRIAKIQALEAKIERLPGEIIAVRSSWERADAAYKTAAAEAEAAEREHAAAKSDFDKTDAVLAEALAEEEAERRLAAKRDMPVSVFISRAKQRLYVRLGYDDIFNAEVAFERPDEPIGTHVFTALAYAPQKDAMTWSAVSVPHDPSRRARQQRKNKKANKQAESPPAVDLASQTPAAALERITIPEDVRERIADVMKPGSSVVISDLGIGNETGKYTDFIVPIR